MFRFYKEDSSMTIDHDEPVNASDSPQVSTPCDFARYFPLLVPCVQHSPNAKSAHLDSVSAQAIQAAIMASISGARVIQPILLDAQVSISRSLLLLVSGSLELRVSDQIGTTS